MEGGEMQTDSADGKWQREENNELQKEFEAWERMSDDTLTLFEACVRIRDLEAENTKLISWVQLLHQGARLLDDEVEWLENRIAELEVKC
jgi:hypothetical protein